MADVETVTYFAEADFRNRRTPFGIKGSDRDRHVYVIGKTGMGKSTLLENMAVQDIQNGQGMGFIDPHGGSAEALLDYVPKERMGDVIYFAPFDTNYPVSFNVMEDVGKDKRHLVANGLMSAFKKIWVDAWSARMEYILGNTLLALLEYPGATLLSVNRMLVDKEYRKKVVEYVTDPTVKSFWVDEFAKYTDRYTQEATPAIQNKIGQFVSNPIIRNIIGQPKSTFDIREVMDKKKILIMNLSKGKMGEQNANLIGSMLVTKIYLAAMSRADLTRAELANMPPFYFYVDEFQSFANESFADILSEARKYKLSLTIAHQYIEQMPEEVRDAVFGNVGTFITFRVGSYDAEVLEKEFAPTFTAEDIVNLDKRQIYLRLMIDGVSSKPFSAVTVPPIVRPDISFRDEIIEHSRKFFARSREEVEKEIADWHSAGSPVSAPHASGTGGQNGYSGEAKERRAASASDRSSASWGSGENRPPHLMNSANGNFTRRESRERPPRENGAFRPFEPMARKEFGAESLQNGTPRRHTPPEFPKREPREISARTESAREKTLGTEIAAALKRGREDDTEDKTDAVPVRPMPLDSLKNHSSSIGEKGKQQSAENKNALKDALLGALKSSKQKSVASPEPPQEKENKDTKTHHPKEIPEDLLRSMLRMEDEK